MAYNEGDSANKPKPNNEPHLETDREWRYAVFQPLGRVPMYQIAAQAHRIHFEASLGGQGVRNSSGLSIIVPEGRAHIRLSTPQETPEDLARIQAFWKDMTGLIASYRRRGLT